MGIEGSEIQKLFIRLPVKIEDEVVIRDLHPNIVQVHLPRQKSRRWCVIDFESKKKLQQAVQDLKKIKINNRSIKIKPYRKQQKKKKNIVKLEKDSNKSLELLLKQN